MSRKWLGWQQNAGDSSSLPDEIISSGSTVQTTLFHQHIVTTELTSLELTSLFRLINYLRSTIFPLPGV